MSISSSLSNALSGLTAASRAAELVSANVANAMTEGYARREILLSNRTLGHDGAGVKIEGVLRVVDPQIIADRRVAEANLAYSDGLASGIAHIEAVIGEPGTGGSLSDRLSDFEAALIEASARPDSTARLDALASSGRAIASQVRSISSEIQAVRMDADASIAAQVEQLNAALGQVQELNHQIYALGNAGRDASGLLDQRQRVVDQIASIVPVREVPRDGGQIALYTTKGAILIDGPPAEITFSPVGMITPDMTQASGALSGISINGIAVPTGPNGLLGGGSLAAAFDLRDNIAPGMQAELDALSRDLVERFQDPAVDQSLSVGDPGLFTDGTGAFDPVDELGLAARLQFNATADPEAGGDSWRLRAGLGAAGPGEVGDSTLLNALGAALSASRAPASGPSTGIAKSPFALAADFLSGTATARQWQASESAYETTRLESLRASELAGGVDTDQEMQKLLLIEKAYAANARVVQTIDALIDELLRI